MMSRVFVLIISLLISLAAIGQEYNHVDEDGKRQGKWRKFHVDSEKLFYTGQFLNDKPVGEFIYYYKDGGTKGIMNYDQIGKHCHSEAYYESGSLLAKGNYIDQKKDSTWQYFTKSNQLKSIENWKKGVKDGEEITYYAEGAITEKIEWKDGKREGVWEQYFKNGKPKVIGAYIEDQFEGMLTYYYPDGKKEIEGKYIEGLRDGTWYYYNEDGSIYMQTLYSVGKVIKEKKETGLFSEYAADNVLLSEINYVKGKKEGAFKIYHEGAEWVIEPTFDEKMNETYNKQVLKGHHLKMTGLYKDDKLNGIVKHYNRAGQFVREEHYVGGVLK